MSCEDRIKLILALVLMVLLLIAIVLGAKVEAKSTSAGAVYTSCFLTVMVSSPYGGHLVFC